MRIIHIFLAVFITASAVNASAAQLEKKKTTAIQSIKSPQAKSAQSKKPSVTGKKYSQLSVAAKGKALSKSRSARIAKVAYEPPSLGRLTGLHNVRDELDLKSSVALVIDQDTKEVLFRKNDATVLPIASITKLMTAVIVSEANLAMNEVITITQEDVVGERGLRSRLKVGMELTRHELLHLALMSSENRAAHALGRTYPGGLDEFIKLMNAKANMLGMVHTRYVEPTGLSSDNRSTAQDLALLVSEASKNPTISSLSTSHGYQLTAGNKTIQYVNTNRLTSNETWEIGLQKTGYIASAGRCLVMQAKVAGRKLVMVFLDSTGKYSRLGDAERVRAWVEGRSSHQPHA
jgi:serine-type D-Ala-D-Ala endopeptidase (penicillin-binding protein 7)